MKEFLSITKAMGDESRLRALLALAGGELCLCQIIELLGLAPSTVSKHMAVLHHAGLVETRKQGRWIFYSLAEARPPLASAPPSPWHVSVWPMMKGSWPTPNASIASARWTATNSAATTTPKRANHEP